MKSAYMNSITGRKRPSSAMPPPSPVNAFSLIGVPRIRSGKRSLSPRVAPFVPPLSRWMSSPRTTMRSSVSIRRFITPATASMNLTSAVSPEKSSRSDQRSPSSSLRSPRTPTSTKAGSGHSDCLIWRSSGLPPGTASVSSPRIPAIRSFARAVTF